MQNSYFDGTLSQYVGYTILGTLLTIFTFGIFTPWYVTMMQSWKAKHTVIDGQRLRFDGSAGSLFGQWIKWLLLIIVTFGIYAFWVNIKMQQWITKNTHFDY